MRIPPYWSKGWHTGVDRRGRECSYQAWGWSFESPEAARSEAEARARRRFEAGDRKLSRESYDYLDVPLREEIVETIEDNDAVIALITRNRYGSLVLNTASVCFVDVDYPGVRAHGLLDALGMLFSPGRRASRQQALRESTRQRIFEWAADNSHRGFRLYETAAGLRLLFTDKCYGPKSDEVAALFEVLQSDLLYRRLTIRQECFRARLTPKPWRCGCHKPPNRYPWDTEAEEQRYRDWEHDYHERTKDLPVCRLLEAFGPAPAYGKIQRVIEMHDAYTCLDSGQSLA